MGQVKQTFALGLNRGLGRWSARRADQDFVDGDERPPDRVAGEKNTGKGVGAVVQTGLSKRLHERGILF
jgi:hypothetical protein